MKTIEKKPFNCTLFLQISQKNELFPDLAAVALLVMMMMMFGDEWDSFKCHMRLHRPQGVQQIPLTLADNSRKFMNDHQRLYRYLDRHCAKALRTLRSLVPSQAKWATYFRVTPSDLQHNIEVVKREMVRKGYAHSRWKPQLARHLSKWGVEQPVLHASGL